MKNNKILIVLILIGLAIFLSQEKKEAKKSASLPGTFTSPTTIVQNYDLSNYDRITFEITDGPTTNLKFTWSNCGSPITGGSNIATVVDEPWTATTGIATLSNMDTCTNAQLDLTQGFSGTGVTTITNVRFISDSEYIGPRMSMKGVEKINGTGIEYDSYGGDYVDIHLSQPEITEIKYWVHLLLIVLIVYFMVNTFVQPMDITIKNVLLGILFLGISDILVHTSLKLD